MGGWSECHRDYYFPSHYSVRHTFGANHTHDGVCSLGIQGKCVSIHYFTLVFTIVPFQIYNRSSAIIPLLMLLALLQGMTGTTLELFSFVLYCYTLIFTGMSFGEFSMPSGMTLE